MLDRRRRATWTTSSMSGSTVEGMSLQSASPSSRAANATVFPQRGQRERDSARARAREKGTRMDIRKVLTVLTKNRKKKKEKKKNKQSQERLTP
jgi:hypothetical protein